MSALVEQKTFDFRLSLAPHKYNGLYGFSAGFSTEDENGLWSDKIGLVTADNASAVIGAVKSALVEKLNDSKWEYVLFISKDDVDRRHRIYLAVVKRSLHELNVSCGYREEEIRGAKIVILAKKGVNTNLIQSSF